MRQHTSGQRLSWGGQFLHTAVGMVLFQALALVSGVLVARGLGPEGQGKFQLIVSVSMFLSILVRLGLDEGLAYQLPNYQQTRPNAVAGLIAYAVGMPTVLSVAISLLLWGVSGWPLVGQILGDNLLSQMAYLPWLLPSTTLLLMNLAVLRGLGRSDLRAYVYYYGVGIAYLVGLGVLGVAGLTSETVVASRTGSYVLGSLLTFGIIAGYLKRGWRQMSGVEFRKVHSFGFFVILSGLLQYMVDTPLVDLIIVGRVGTDWELGVYSVASRIGLLVALVANAMTVALGPILANLQASQLERRDEVYRKASEWMARLSTFAGLGILLMRTEALMLFGSDYTEGSTLLLVFTLGNIGVSLLGLNAPLLLSAGYAKLEFALTLVAGLLMIVLGTGLGIAFGALGVAAATAASALLLGLARRIAVGRVFGLRTLSWIVPVAIAGLAAYLPAELLRNVDGGVLRSLVALAVFVGVYLIISWRQGALDTLPWRLGRDQRAGHQTGH